MKKSIINKFSLLFISFFLFPIISHAAYASLSASGGTVTVGKQITVTLHLNSVDDGNNLQAVGGYINFDSNYLDLNSCTGSLNYNSANRKFAYFDQTGNGMASGNVGSCTFTTKAVGNTSVSFKITSAATVIAEISASSPSANVSIKEPPSNNNNLASLSVSPGGINFNGGTSYSTSVGASTTSVTVSAAAQDAKARISGTGPHNLNYGANNINVVVTAEDGSKKTYSINVNRKDDRSSNNNLASLSISNGKLSPGFSKGNTKYSMEVPFATSKLNLNAKAEDAKANVSISNPELVAEETTTVSIKVTAENGSSKTYTISVKRGKDPNKPLSNNNYLDALTVSTGMLSPAFNKEKLNYAVYLPFEINHIDVGVHQEDTKYATIKSEGSSDLSIGNNLFKYTVTAEDGSTRVYTLTVVRNKSLEDISSKSNVYLKKLELSDGKLVKKFNKKDNVIYYKKSSSKVKIKLAIPEDKNSVVQTYKLNKSFVIMVESTSGERNFYLLVEKSNIMLYVFIALIALVLVLILIVSKLKKKKNKDDINKEKTKKIRKAKKNKELN